MYVAQQCFGSSDEGTEDALYDSQAIRRFVGVDLSREAAPAATTLLNFHHLLEAHQLTESIFNTINAHLAEKGLFLREGTLVDATLIAAANIHDITQALLHGGETDVFDDAGYPGVEKREENLALPMTWHVAMRPGKHKALPKTTEGELLEKIEHTKASVRAKVEHPFYVVKNWFRHRKTRYKGLG